MQRLITCIKRNLLIYGTVWKYHHMIHAILYISCSHYALRDIMYLLLNFMALRRSMEYLREIELVLRIKCFDSIGRIQPIRIRVYACTSPYAMRPPIRLLSVYNKTDTYGYASHTDTWNASFRRRTNDPYAFAVATFCTDLNWSIWQLLTVELRNSLSSSCHVVIVVDFAILTIRSVTQRRSAINH